MQMKEKYVSLVETTGVLPRREVVALQRIRAVWLNCYNF